MATTEGSLITMPRLRTVTSVFAVPRSMPTSWLRRPSRPSKSPKVPLVMLVVACVARQGGGSFEPDAVRPGTPTRRYPTTLPAADPRDDRAPPGHARTRLAVRPRMVNPMTTTTHAPPADQLVRLARGEHHDPHSILGTHLVAEGTVVRAFHPDATAAALLAPNGGTAPMESIGHGVWAGVVPDLAPGQFSYRVRFTFADGNTWEREDPYRFGPTIGEVDLHLIGEGTHERLYDVLGAHPRTHEGVSGVSFAVWAPNARSVRIVGDFDRWDGRLLPLRSMGATGVWELFVPGIGVGELYKFEILGADGTLRLKADPFAFAMQGRPETAWRVWDPSVYAWTDADWMERRPGRDPYRSPMAAYEVHLGSWMRNDDGSWLGYRQAAEKLVEHCRRFGFTHVELLPVAEHPFDGSWGYQVTGYFAPTSRFGNPDDFAAMVDTLHNAGIGVIVDWVPAHFPTDDFALRRFDGTPLYEHADPQRGEHPDWGTLIFRSEERRVGKECRARGWQ